MVVVIATLTFILYTPFFLSATLGFAIGLFGLTVQVIIRNRSLLNEWPEGATQGIISAIFALLFTGAVWILLASVSRGPLNLGSLQNEAGNGYIIQVENLIPEVKKIIADIWNEFGFQGFVLGIYDFFGGHFMSTNIMEYFQPYTLVEYLSSICSSHDEKQPGEETCQVDVGPTLVRFDRSFCGRIRSNTPRQRVCL